MWEAIQANVRRSRLLIGVMALLLISLGALIGLSLSGAGEGGVLGAGAALLVWLVLLIAALGGGERLLLLGTRARKIRKEDAPRLWNVIEEMTIAAGLGRMPTVYVIDDEAPNAFAAGRNPEVACVTVTSGLLRRLNRDELQGVVAHEIAHIKNLDVRFLTIATVMVGSIAILSDAFLRSLWWGGGRRRSAKGGGQAQLAILAITILAAVLAPLCAYALYFACSRKREYLADASAARFTRYPAGLASALEKISAAVGRQRKSVSRAMAPMYIVNPLQASGASAGLFSTHPPTTKRVRILREMAGAAGWVDYERAYRKVAGPRESCLDAKTLSSEKSVAARRPTGEADGRTDAVERTREVNDLLDRLVEFLFIACPCGVRIKVPPNLARDTVSCTRCGRAHAVPRVGGASAGPNSSGDDMKYHRRGRGWESFKCRCGKVQQLSPAFDARSLTCRGCRRKIEIVG